ncbi:MAG: hypothetical protein NC238_13420 [Dehalobacter sp.]|nr:hypothetical protein [Dehalobacter sp.]
MKILASYSESNLLQKVGIIFGLLGSILGITLWVILLFFNPYSREQQVSYIYILTQIFPGVVGLVSAILKKVWLMVIVFIILLPLGFYMALTPGVFKYFGLVLVFYWFSICFQ